MAHPLGLVHKGCGFRVNFMQHVDFIGNRWNQNGPNQFSANFTGNSPSSPRNNNRMDDYSYDTAGNLLSDGTSAYTYDAEHRIIHVVNVNFNATYTYDANGRRVERTGFTHDTCDASGKRDYFYDLAGHAIMEVNSNGTACSYEIFAGNRHLGSQSGGTTYSHTDWLGTERARIVYATASNRALDKHCTSLPFGDALSCTTLADSPLHFTGKERDSESGNDNFGARYFTSTMGRFLTPDWSANPSTVPYANLTDPQSLNLYSYVVNNPLNRIDPLGHNWFYLDNKWQWHEGDTYTYKDSQGNSQTATSKYTGLLVAQATGTDKKTGATTYSLTLYDQNKTVFTGTAYSGGGGNPAIKDGNYTMRLDIRDPNGPTTINPQSPLSNPLQFYGIQRIHDFNLADGSRVEIEGAYGHLRTHLNPWHGTDQGDFLHEQYNGAGYTHGCLCYGTQTQLSNILWNMPPQRLPAAVDVPVTPP